MPRPRLVPLALSAGLLTAALGLGACSGGSSAPPSEAPLTGSSITAADDVSALCAQVVDQGLPGAAAQALIESSGYVVRIEGATASAGASEAAVPTSAGQVVVLTVSGDAVTACALG